MVILGIETSCDETAAALVKAEGDNLSVLSDAVSSQIKLHSKWGGVVPNLAAREHVKNIVPVLDATLRKAGLSRKNIGLIAVTRGPGLIPALLVGTNAAKTLSYVWNKPLLGIHHIEGHIYANFIGDKIGGISNFKFKISNFPILCLVVSGGHTQLVLMNNHLNYKIVGQTLDDAAGEAFDKVARILGLGYPGGPAIAATAAKISNFKFQISNFRLPRPMLNKNNFDFSFSGLKTAVLYKVKELRTINQQLKIALAYEFQQAVIDVLVSKTIKAAKKYNPKTIMLAGGVSANQKLRKRMAKAVKKSLPYSSFIIPSSSYCIDNAAMIAAAGYFRWKNMSKSQKANALDNWKKLEADAGLKLK